MFPGEFTQDPDVDINTTPSNYFDHRGAAVRIKVFWTKPIYENKSLLAHSLQLLRATNAILRKYTLSLDVQPLGTASVAEHAKAHKKIHDALEAKRKQASGFSGTLFRVASPIVEAGLNEAVDKELDDADMASKGRIPYDGTLVVQEGGTPSIEQFRPLRQLIDPNIKEENRLIVAFVSMSGADGFAALYADWLPWVLVDPRDFSDMKTLMHEIGHACRLAHQQVDGVATAEVRRHHNFMSYSLAADQFWGWQVEAIYNSYWCEGRKPKTWWDTRSQAVLPVDHPWLWEEAP